MTHDLFNSFQTFAINGGKTGKFYSLPQLEKEGVGPISKLPVSIRIVVVFPHPDTPMTTTIMKAISTCEQSRRRRCQAYTRAGSGPTRILKVSHRSDVLAIQVVAAWPSTMWVS